MRLSQRERYIAYALGAVLGLALLDGVLLSPLLARLNEADGRIAVAKQELVAADQTLQNSLRARRRWKEMAGDTVQADASSAESQLLNASRQWAATAGLAVTSLKLGRADPAKDFARSVVQVAATGTLDQVSRFLFAIQSAGIPVRVADVQISARQEGTDDLAVQITLATIYEPPTAAAASDLKAGER